MGLKAIFDEVKNRIGEFNSSNELTLSSDFYESSYDNSPVFVITAKSGEHEWSVFRWSGESNRDLSNFLKSAAKPEIYYLIPGKPYGEDDGDWPDFGDIKIPIEDGTEALFAKMTERFSEILNECYDSDDAPMKFRVFVVLKLKAYRAFKGAVVERSLFDNETYCF